MTADEFAAAYAARSGLTVEVLRQHGREVRPCDCGADNCEGWQMAHVKEDAWFVAAMKADAVAKRQTP